MATKQRVVARMTHRAVCLDRNFIFAFLSLNSAKLLSHALLPEATLGTQSRIQRQSWNLCAPYQSQAPMLARNRNAETNTTTTMFRANSLSLVIGRFSGSFVAS